MIARIPALALCVAALVLVPAAAFAKGSSNSKTFTDTRHEDARAPDVTSVVVSNDDARNIQFRINISNRPVLTADMTIVTYVDADRKTSTGDRSTRGADYAIELDKGAVTLFQWTGSDYTYAAEQGSLKYTYDRKGATIRLNASDLNDSQGFRFAVVAVSGIGTNADGSSDFSNAHRDVVPNADDGFASFTVIAKLSLKATAFSVSPAPAKAGERLSASLATEETDTDSPLSRGKVTCTGTVGGRAVVATHTLAYGVATCNWLLPRSAKGKTFRGTITVSAGAAKIVKRISTRVR